MNKETTEYFERLANASDADREEMTDEEVQSVAVDIAVRKLQSKGIEVIKASPDLNSHPSIWFKKDSEVKYVVVTFARYPKAPSIPSDANQIFDHFKEEGYTGYWVGVTLANEMEVFDPESDEGMVLMKGFGLLPKIGDLVPLTSFFN
jgi:hypothetical protein